MSVAEEHEQVSRAAEIDIDDGAGLQVAGRVEALDEVDAIVEVPVALPSDQYAVIVVVLLIGSPVEIGVGGHSREFAAGVVAAPEVRPSITVAILAADPPSGNP